MKIYFTQKLYIPFLYYFLFNCKLISDFFVDVVVVVECDQEVLMPWAPGSEQGIMPGKNHDVSDIDKLIKGKKVETIGKKKNPKFTVLLKEPKSVEITVLKMVVKPVGNVDEVTVKLAGVQSEVSVQMHHSCVSHHRK